MNARAQWSHRVRFAPSASDTRAKMDGVPQCVHRTVIVGVRSICPGSPIGERHRGRRRGRWRASRSARRL
jgi:hypothetical protein